MKDSEKRYRVYEYMRDNKEITEEMSNTKKIILKLMNNDKQTEEYCNKKILEEKQEIEEAMIGEHYHENMTKREILINEISQYIYWQTLLAVSKKIKYEDFDGENKIEEILKKVDIKKIEETKLITVNEVILHDLEQMKNKEYLRQVIV